MKIKGRMCGQKHWRIVRGAESLNEVLAFFRWRGYQVRRIGMKLIAVDKATGYVVCEVKQEDK